MALASLCCKSTKKPCCLHIFSSSNLPKEHTQLIFSKLHFSQDFAVATSTNLKFQIRQYQQALDLHYVSKNAFLMTIWLITFYPHSYSPVVFRRHSRNSLEILTEERLWRESQLLTYLQDREIAVFQQSAGLTDHILVNPVSWRLPAYVLDDCKEVLYIRTRWYLCSYQGRSLHQEPQGAEDCRYNGWRHGSFL